MIDTKGQIQITLRAARVNAELTVVEASKALGIGKEKLLKWEHNPGQITVLDQQKISEVYGLPLDFIKFLP